MPIIVLDLIRMYLITDVVFVIGSKLYTYKGQKLNNKEYGFGILVGQLLSIVYIYFSIYKVLG